MVSGHGEMACPNDRLGSARLIGQEYGRGLAHVRLHRRSRHGRHRSLCRPVAKITLGVGHHLILGHVAHHDKGGTIGPVTVREVSYQITPAHALHRVLGADAGMAVACLRSVQQRSKRLGGYGYGLV